jgi:hypothetical protein
MVAAIAGPLNLHTYGGPSFFKWSLDVGLAVVVGIVMVKALTGIWCM